ncbi:hypothetical protein ACTL32_05535 [Planococcus sp. FY231025]|uniref:hypothetical protein n=1 Tax=Planococcus sp. FY231025 TaxID=3455699 RepID=UPI003F926172
MEFILVLILLLLWVFVAERVVRKVLKVEKTDLEDTPGAKTRAWGQGTIIFLSLLIIPSADMGWREGMMWIWSIYLTTFTAIDAFLQRKYIPESQEHLATLTMFPIGVGTLVGISFLLF